jgi:choline-sulfatase
VLQSTPYFDIIKKTGKQMIHKKKVITLLIVTLVIFFSFNSCTKKKVKDYNVVLIVIDALRADHLPIYGYEKNTAPFLLELSKQSVVFENTFSASSWTSPGTASIFTSMYPYQHGVLMGLLAIRNAQKIDPNIKINRIPEEINTITEVMKKNGYRTYGVADNLNISEKQGFTQGFDKFETYMYKAAPKVNQTVKSWKNQLMSNGKYFLYIHYMEPHAPYHPRKPWFKPDEDPDKERISAYDSEINFADLHIKELFESFAWDKNTILIITADHGEGLWDHGIMTHGKSLYREELQVPLIFHLPGEKIGRRISTNASTIDILPTVRALLGLPPDNSDEGMSLVPLIENQKHDLESRNIYSYLWVKTGKKIEWKSTIYKNWHFVIQLPNSRQLYSLLKDRKERDNQFFKGYNTARLLEQRFEDFMKKSKKYRQKSTTYKLDEEKTNQLKSLGYVEDK